MILVIVFLILVLFMVGIQLSIEAGYRFGRRIASRRGGESESSVSATVGSILGLLAFVLAFTFDSASDRFSQRDNLVMEEANVVRTAWYQSDYLPEPNRSELREVMTSFLETRLRLAHSAKFEPETVRAALVETESELQRWHEINRRLVSSGIDSDLAAILIDLHTQVAALHAQRVNVAIQKRIPKVIWFMLVATTLFGMASLGYLNGISGQRRSRAQALIGPCFALVLLLIALLDMPPNKILSVSQQPQEQLLLWMKGTSGPGTNAEPQTSQN